MSRTKSAEPDSPSGSNPPEPPALPRVRTDPITPTVASRGKAAKPTDAQRAKFAAVIAAPEFTDAERQKYGTWAATHATRHTMYEYTDWLSMERFRRTRATHEEAA